MSESCPRQVGDRTGAAGGGAPRVIEVWLLSAQTLGMPVRHGAVTFPRKHCLEVRLQRLSPPPRVGRLKPLIVEALLWRARTRTHLRGRTRAKSGKPSVACGSNLSPISAVWSHSERENTSGGQMLCRVLRQWKPVLSLFLFNWV